MRVLITITPQMYRQALGLALLKHRPGDDVLLAAPEELEAQTERFSPHALVRNYDGEGSEVPRGVVCWVGVLITDSMNAVISVGGRTSDAHDVTMNGLLSALDKAEALVESRKEGVC